MSKKFSLAIEIGGVLKESFKSAIGTSKHELKAVQRLANIKIGASLDTHKEKLKEQLSSWKSILGTAVSMGTPVIIGANFEFQMKRVKALANATGEDFKKLVEKAKELGSSTQYSASEVGKAMEYLSMAGFKVNETLQATSGVLNLATVGNVDLATSADIASNILSGFGLKAKDMNRVVDVMAKTITSSNTSVVELGYTMKYVAPIASKLGASIEEVSAMAGLLGNIGIKGSDAGTALRTMFLRLSSPTGEAQKTLQRLGVSVKDANGKMRPMVDILKDLYERMKNLSNTQKMAYLKAIFGEEPASAVSELINKAGTGELQKYIQQIKNAKGAAEKMVQDMNDTVLAKWKSVLSALESLFLTIYEPLEPIIKFALDVVVGGLRALNKVLEFTAPVLAPVVFGLGSLFITSKLVAIGMTLSKIASLEFVKAVLLSLTPIGQFQNSLKLLSTQSVLTTNTLKLSSLSLRGFLGAIKSFSLNVVNVARFSFEKVKMAAISMGRVLLTNPVFWIGAAVAGVGFLIYKNWKKVKLFFSGFWDGFKEGFKPVLDSFHSLYNSFKPVIATLKTGFEEIKKVFSPLSPLFSSIGKAFNSMFGNKEEVISAGVLVGKVVGKAFSLVLTPVVWITKFIGFLVEEIGKVGSALSKGISPVFVLFDLIKGAFFGMKVAVETFGNIISKVGAAVKSALESPFRLIDSFIKKILHIFSLLKDNPVFKALGFGKSLIGGAIKTVSQFFSSTHKHTSKEESIHRESKIKSVREIIKERKAKEQHLKVEKLIDQIVINITASSKDIAKDIEAQIPNIKEQVYRLMQEFMEDYERKMRLSHGR